MTPLVQLRKCAQCGTLNEPEASYLSLTATLVLNVSPTPKGATAESVDLCSVACAQSYFGEKVVAPMIGETRVPSAPPVETA